MKLVKQNKVTKFPKSPKRVRDLFRDALHKAETNKYETAIVVIKQKDNVICGWSRGKAITQTGMLDIAKNIVYESLGEIEWKNGEGL